MKLKILALLLALLASSYAEAALVADGTTYVIITDSAILTLPDNDWTLFGRFRQVSNVGTGSNYLLGWGRAGAVGGATVRCIQATEASTPDDIRVDIHDGTTGEVMVTTSNPCATTTWQTFAVTRTGGDGSNADFTVYLNGAVAIGPTTDDAINAIDPDLACIGRHSVSAACSATGTNQDAEFTDLGMWTRALSAAEITTLQKFSAGCLSFGQAVFIPLIREPHTPIGQLTLSFAGIDVFADGPPIIYCE